MQEEIVYNSKSSGYAWLSAMHPCTFQDEYGATWLSLESYYQAGKSALNKDRLAIAKMNGWEAKKYAKNIELIPVWEQTKVLRMYKGMFFILAQHPDLQAKLMSTKIAILVHDCPWGDTFWGLCKGKGFNIQGSLWMQHRARWFKYE
jgi:predicted NAD-dependent protein-ADP-ribosyltransferase YbiA (DUF1768 family)